MELFFSTNVRQKGAGAQALLSRQLACFSHWRFGVVSEWAGQSFSTVRASGAGVFRGSGRALPPVFRNGIASGPGCGTERTYCRIP